MAHRPPGRPKAREPRVIKITVRLTEREADLLQRLAQEESLSAALRHALAHYIRLQGGAANVRDTERALIRRELRKAQRAASPEADALAQVFALDAPPEPRRGLASPRLDPDASKPLRVLATTPRIE
jgi:hypothetical protein